MHRIDGAGHIGNQFVNEDDSISRPPTELTDDWLNAVQGEIANVIEGAGLALSKLDNTQLWTAIKSAGLEVPLAALDYPTIATATNRMTVTPEAAISGGNVSIAAGARLTLASEVVAGVTGMLRGWTVPAYQSADLDISSTYYLRAKIVANVLTLYVQKGTDADVIPPGLTGTPGGAIGGGFDSTVLDLLIAKITTGIAGTVPTVIALANASRLYAGFTGALDLTPGSAGVYTHTINWARKPSLHALPAVGDISGPTVTTDMRQSVTSTRYTVSVDSYGFDNTLSSTQYFKPAYRAELMA